MSAPSITIAGLGLIGGSLAHALHAAGAAARVHGVDPDPAALAAARAAGVIDAACPTLAAAPPSDVLILAGPVGRIVAALEADAAVARHAVVTDVGSVKAPMVRAAAAGGVLERYAGAHPLCGDHRAGFGAARADLFTGATVYVLEESAAEPRRVVSTLWQQLGGRVVLLEAAAHDALVAQTSHLPQAAATALAHALAAAGIRVSELGPGGLDATRLAASDVHMWLDIFLHNASALAGPLAQLERSVFALRHAVAAGDAGAIRALLEEAAAWRRA